jgi:cellulose synthase/poly-beta-1,6-N-acetylglucosamine synthase-like glycosyltransferase
MKALMEGIPTTWAHDAVIYDEKPLTFKAAWNQRVRWAQGNFDVANRYIPKMLFKGIKEHNILLLDGVIDMFQPYFLLNLGILYHLLATFTNLFLSIPTFSMTFCLWQYGKPSVSASIFSPWLY